MSDFNFKYSNVYSRANVAAYKAKDGSIYITVAIHPFDVRDSVIRCCAMYLPGEGRRAAMDFQAIVTGEFDLRERFGSISVPADAEMLALCGSILLCAKWIWSWRSRRKLSYWTGTLPKPLTLKRNSR